MTSFTSPTQRAAKVTAESRIEMFHPGHFNACSQDLPSSKPFPSGPLPALGEGYAGKLTAIQADLPSAAAGRKQPVSVVIRVDASLQMATGHVMRCLTLADALRAKGAKVQFICRKLEGNLINFIESKNYHVFTLEVGNSDSTSDNEPLAHAGWLGATQEEDAHACKAILEDIRPNWLIVDHYALDYRWEAALKHDYQNLMVIDDLADRKHWCELLLDQTFGREQGDYKSLVPETCTLLLGSQYALLRPEFTQWREYSLKRRTKPELKKILVTMGGVDLENVTAQVLESLGNSPMSDELELVVIMGPTSPHLASVKKLAETLPLRINLAVNVSNMAEMMANADLAIGAAGATTWERCCLGLPSIVIVLADNQQKVADNLSGAEMVKVLTKHNLAMLYSTISKLSAELATYAAKAASVTDGSGAKNILAVMESV